MFDYQLEFKLNAIQQQCSDDIVDYYRQGHNILLDAVCGAGKTEMLLEVIKIALNNNIIIGFACPRKELLKDLHQRLSKYFNEVNFGVVTGDTKQNMKSNFVFLTTHQLPKYQRYFDLLIIDEIDAFPFYNNYQLENAALQAAKQFIFLSASVPLKYYELVKLNKLSLVSNYQRFHQKLMPVPEIITSQFSIIKALSIIIPNPKPWLVFVPNIKLGYKYQRWFRLCHLKSKFVYSKTITKTIINEFRHNKYQILISTTVLERGYTFKDVNVMVINSDSNIFDEATLLQIAGRVGRDSQYHQGMILFFCHHHNEEMQKCIERIKVYNEMFLV